MRQLEKWISCNKGKSIMSIEELFLTGRELDQNEVSIKVGNVFPITFCVVVNVSLLSRFTHFNYHILK